MSLIQNSLFIFFLLGVSPVLYASSSSGGSGGATAVSGSGSRASESSPNRVDEARESMRERLRQKAITKANNQKPYVNFDHSYADVNDFLGKYVQTSNDKTKTYVNYTGIDKSKLDLIVKEMLQPSHSQVMVSFTPKERLAYFVNLYNILTIQLIVENYSEIKENSNSIKELGGLFSSPWKKKFFTLFGRPHSLDEIEHGYIRGELPGFEQSQKEFKDPRIHVAVNCASKGCPALSPVAFRPNEIESQFESTLDLFLKDRNRNKVDVKNKTVTISKIFDWYEKDFERGLLDYTDLKKFIQINGDALSDSPEQRALLQSGKFDIEFSDYDWTLNDTL
ncbi:MAG: DUF547 domain-containing protein [Bdellovibrionaceae bacterium]|nr:DUF547 domain-containing protein [Pseudobdellovibrionaceae bacterium]